MMIKHLALAMVGSVLLAACAGGQGPTVYKHPETKSIVLLQGDTMQCEPLFRKAGFERVDTGAVEK